MIDLNPYLSLIPIPAIFSGGFWNSPSGFPKLVNLLIFIAILFYLLRKPVRDFFNQRFAGVREVLEKAAREKSAAEAKMKELDARLSRLGDELAEIKTQAQTEAVAVRQRMEAETRLDIDKLRIWASREIEAAKQVAMGDLREFAATKSVELAEQMIQRELTPQDDALLLQRVGEEIGRKVDS